MNKKYNVAVIGATGGAGRETMKILADRGFPVDNIYAVASMESVGKSVSFGDDDTVEIISLDKIDFSKVDIVFSSAGSTVSKEFVGRAVSQGAIVIDKTSCFRMDEDVALVVPEVNGNEIAKFKKSRIISTPNCIVIPVVTALKPLDNAVKISRIVMSTYQSVSGAGMKAMDELYNNTKSKYSYQQMPHQVFEKEIAFNIIPKIGAFDRDGYTDEEVKIVQEVHKIMARPIPTTVTSVRVPVFIGHAISINVEFNGSMSAEDARAILSEADGIILDEKNDYTTPMEVVGADEVFVSRVRNDASRPNTINMWIVTDNLRKGAALNSVQVAEMLIKYI